MQRFINWLAPRFVAHAHCDLMCGVYDPAQARIEAASVLKAVEKYHDADDPVFRERCIQIKEQRAEMTKHHLWVLWTDFFKPHRLEAHPQLHDLFWQATKTAGDVKRDMSPDTAKTLIALIDDIAAVFWRTEEAASAGLYPPR